jgi:hypothetical protein
MGRSKPASIRFDPEKLELIQRKEQLTSAQKVVDFLLDAYWWNNKLVLAPAMKEAAQSLPYAVADQPKTAFEAYDQKIKLATTAFEINAIGGLMEVDPFLRRDEREKLTKMAENKAKSFEIQ